MIVIFIDLFKVEFLLSFSVCKVYVMQDKGQIFIFVFEIGNQLGFFKNIIDICSFLFVKDQWEYS